MARNATADRSASSEQGSLSLYLRELSRIAPLDFEEERSCARFAAQGDETSRQRLIRSNLRFVVMLAKRYRDRGVPLEDLVNEGNIGLIRAAGRFDPERGIRFVTYAGFWIRQAMAKAIHEDGCAIRVPRSGRSGHLRVLAQAARATVSLDAPIADGDDADSLGDRLADRGAAKPEEVLLRASMKEELDAVLARLSTREAGILQERFGLAGRARSSLREAGRRHGLSKERVRQIERRALRRIRVSDRARRLEAYAN